MLDIEKIASDVVRELLLRAEADKLRAEGVQLLYGRIRQQAEQDSKPTEPPAGEKPSVPQAVPVRRGSV